MSESVLVIDVLESIIFIAVYTKKNITIPNNANISNNVYGSNVAL